MLSIRKSNERGRGERDWLKSWHTFSFADYYDSNNMGFRSLRVINEDEIKGGRGFAPHPHRDMEIITYVIEGALEHKDSMNNQSVIRPGEVQRMSAGTGVTHSEYNKLQDKRTHLLQIWILPELNGGNPSYEQKSFEAEIAETPKVLVASKDGRQRSVRVHQDVAIYVSRLSPQKEVSYSLASGRGAWVQMVKGRTRIKGQEIEAGDGVRIEQESDLLFTALEPSEFLLFDLA